MPAGTVTVNGEGIVWLRLPIIIVPGLNHSATPVPQVKDSVDHKTGHSFQLPVRTAEMQLAEQEVHCAPACKLSNRKLTNKNVLRTSAFIIRAEERLLKDTATFRLFYLQSAGKMPEWLDQGRDWAVAGFHKH